MPEDSKAKQPPARGPQTTSLPGFGQPADLTNPVATPPSSGGEESSADSAALILDLEPLPAFQGGDVLAGRYQIVRYISEGGMGEVYEAEDRELSEHVALKTVKPEIAREKGALDRFRREIHLARKVTHPNVCRIFDLGHHSVSKSDGSRQEVMFLTMELLAGETLAQRLRRSGPLDVGQALPIVEQMVAALATAHRADVVHRDFKPGNVILVPSKSGERVVVTDFGLAHGFGDGGEVSAASTFGKLVGTPAYMAPEQVMALPTGPKADIYALGVVLFEMVTGRWPFRGESPLATTLLRLQQPAPSPRSIVPDLDMRWETAILRCLQRKPEERFDSVTDLLSALGTEPPKPARVPRWLPLALAGALAAAGLGYWVARSPRAAAPATSAAASRRAVAVLGFKNVGPPETTWLATALSEMLRTELAAGEAVRTIPSESIERMKKELQLSETDSLARDTLAKVAANIGADAVVLGSYVALGRGAGSKLRLDVRLQDTASGEILASSAETGTEEDLFDLVSRAGSGLRRTLGAKDITASQARAVRAALPANTEAARLYSEGLSRLQLYDAQGARDLLEKAVAADPRHAAAHAALAAAWSALGYDQLAISAAKRAHELAQGLSPEERRAIEGRLYETTGEWDKAVELYRALFVLHPDVLEAGLRTAAAQAAVGRGEQALATTEALRTLEPPVSQDPRIDLAEAAAAKSLTDFPRQQTAAARAAAKAKRLGARLLFAQARLSEGSALADQGKGEEAERACEEARAIFAAAGDRASAARADNVIAVALVQRGELAAAKKRFEEALRSFEQVGDRRGAAKQLNNMGNVEAEMGNARAARGLYERALAISRETGDRAGIARALNNLGSVLFETKDYEGARRAFSEALGLLEEFGEKRNVAKAHHNLGEVARLQGHLEEAVARQRFAVAMSRESGDQEGTAEYLVHLSRVLSLRQHFAEARTCAEEALDLYRTAERMEGQAQALRALADALDGQGDKAGAAKRRVEAADLERASTD